MLTEAGSTHAATDGHEVVGGLGVLGLVDAGDLVVLGDPPTHRGLEGEGDDEEAERQVSHRGPPNLAQ